MELLYRTFGQLSTAILENCNIVRPDGLATTRRTRNNLSIEADAMIHATRYLVALSESLRWQHLSTDQVLPGHVERIEIDGQHVLYLDQPERVAEEIDRFLSEREL